MTVALFATATMSLAVLRAGYRTDQGNLGWIWTLIVAGGVGGAAMALYWPFLMSWVSSDYEGVQLNRRFGRYNGAWSSGGTIGPLIGGMALRDQPRAAAHRRGDGRAACRWCC